MLTYLPPVYVDGVAISLGSSSYKWSSGYFSGDVSAATGTFTGNVTTVTPTLTNHAATKGYVDGLGAYLINGSVALTAALNVDGNDLGTVGAPAGDAYTTTAHFAEDTAPSAPSSGVTVYATSDGLRAIGDDGTITELTTVVEDI